MLKVLEVKDAQELVLRHLKFEIERIKIEEAVNRILATDVLSLENIPQFSRSTMDGYALNSNETFGASQSVPAIFAYDGDIEMGKKTDAVVESAHCYYVPTGGMVPSGCDAVVMIESTTKIDKEVFVYQPIRPYENVIRIGEDVRKDSIIFKKGIKLNSARIGVLAGAGIEYVNVYKKPRFFVISTGDEIIDISQKVIDTKIRDVNSYLLQTKLIDYCQFCGKAIIDDDYDKLVATIKHGLEIADIVFISGGSSVGSRDYTQKSIEAIGKILVHGLALKPGKPTMVGLSNEKLIVGLPGHPMAALVALQLIYIDCLESLYGCESNNVIYARAKTNFPSASGRATVMPVKLEKDDNGYTATPKFYKSGLINILAQADGYIIIPSFVEGIEKNTLLEVKLL